MRKLVAGRFLKEGFGAAAADALARVAEQPAPTIGCLCAYVVGPRALRWTARRGGGRSPTTESPPCLERWTLDGAFARRWPTPSILSSSTCRSEERTNSAISTHSGWVSAPITGRTGLTTRAQRAAGSLRPGQACVSTRACFTLVWDEHQVRSTGLRVTPAPAGRSRCPRENRSTLSVVVPSGRAATRLRDARSGEGAVAPRQRRQLRPRLRVVRRSSQRLEVLARRRCSLQAKGAAR